LDLEATEDGAREKARHGRDIRLDDVVVDAAVDDEQRAVRIDSPGYGLGRPPGVARGDGVPADGRAHDRRRPVAEEAAPTGLLLDVEREGARDRRDHLDAVSANSAVLDRQHAVVTDTASEREAPVRPDGRRPIAAQDTVVDAERRAGMAPDAAALSNSGGRPIGRRRACHVVRDDRVDDREGSRAVDATAPGDGTG